MTDWHDITEREDLLVARMKQLDAKNLEIIQAAETLRNSRLTNKAYFDEHHVLRNKPLQVGDLILLWEEGPKRNAKLADKWAGPYRIRSIPENSTFYEIEELDGSVRKMRVAGNRVKKFYLREELMRDRILFEEARRRREQGEV